jgi:mannose-6-phosphate isomerase-like protein (cupin superfamily)
MEELSKEILSQLLTPEAEVAPQKTVQPSDVDHWTPAVLLERAAYLRKIARHGDGAAGETLREFPGHAAMLSVRNRDGQAEVHENFADLFYVLDGRAGLVTGGVVVGGVEVAPGEMRGVSIDGGLRQELRSGDLAHVPAGVPHQMLISGENSFTSFVLKVREKE